MGASRLLGRSGLAICAASACAAWAYIAPPYDPAAQPGAQGHDPALLRHAWDGSEVASSRNPGVQAFPAFITEPDAKTLLRDLQPVIKQYGINLIQPTHAAMYRFQQSYLPKSAQAPVNMTRITGRPEAASQRVAPWGYAEAFDESQLTPHLRALVKRVLSIPGLRVGALRDVTINYRHSRFLRLDPHLDPALDGEHVFILGLDSDTVLTLCPVRLLSVWRAGRAALSALTLADERDTVKAEAEQSWTPWDIDVLARKHTLVHLRGPARWTWTHGTRLGVAEGDPPVLCDWWGRRQDIVSRGVARHSVVLAFAAAPDDAT